MNKAVGNTNHLGRNRFISLTQQNYIKVCPCFHSRIYFWFCQIPFIQSTSKTPLQMKVIQSNQQKMVDANMSPQPSGIWVNDCLNSFFSFSPGQFSYIFIPCCCQMGKVSILFVLWQYIKAHHINGPHCVMFYTPCSYILFLPIKTVKILTIVLTLIHSFISAFPITED